MFPMLRIIDNPIQYPCRVQEFSWDNTPGWHTGVWWWWWWNYRLRMVSIFVVTGLGPLYQEFWTGVRMRVDHIRYPTRLPLPPGLVIKTHHGWDKHNFHEVNWVDFYTLERLYKSPQCALPVSPQIKGSKTTPALGTHYITLQNCNMEFLRNWTVWWF